MGAKYRDGTMIGLLAVCLLCASYLTISPSSLTAQGWIEPHVSRGGFSVDKTHSAVYFQLVAALPEIGAVLESFKHVVIARTTVSLRITEKGIGELTDEALEQLVRRFRTAGGTP